jgi:hypothetical protein
MATEITGMKARKWVPIALAATVAVVMLPAAGLWAFTHFVLHGGPMGRCKGHERFDPAAWRDPAQAYGDLAVRGCMVDDLLARNQFRGQSHAQVVALLGEPRRTDYFSEYDLVYWLGPERGMISVDSEWLVFRLDGEGRVAEYRLVTD